MNKLTLIPLAALCAACFVHTAGAREDAVKLPPPGASNI